MHECNSLSAAAAHLRELADELDGMQQALSLPLEDYTLESAAAKLRMAVLSDDCIAITPPAIVSVGRGRPLSVAEWKIWIDRERNWAGSTLTDVVNKALADLRQQAPKLEEVQHALSQATESNIPF